MQMRGVPFHLIDSKVILKQEDLLVVSAEKGTTVKRVSTKKQYEIYKQTLQDITDSYTYCISSVFNSLDAQKAALNLFKAALAISKFNPPYWYQIGGFNDKYTDKNREKIGNPSLIILDGLFVNSTVHKIERLRELIATFDCPKVVITCGVDPAHFMFNQVYCPVNRVLYIGNSKPNNKANTKPNNMNINKRVETL